MDAVGDPLSKTGFVVECHSGHAYAGRPIAFSYLGERFTIKNIDAEWRSPNGKHFQLTTDQGYRVELFYDVAKDSWKIIQI